MSKGFEEQVQQVWRHHRHHHVLFGCSKNCHVSGRRGTNVKIFVKYALFQWEPKSIRQPLKQHGGLQNVWFPLCCHLFVYLPFRQEMDLSPHPTAGGFLADNRSTPGSIKGFQRFLLFSDYGHKVNSTCENRFLSPLTSWLFLCGHLKLQSSSVNRSPYVSSSRAGRYMGQELPFFGIVA